ncbi:MAG: hypothetical protein M3Y03_04600, partial [Verrucomicrobiota bacterium]|nr:hypothetical protein [Verrucomicrobiota bacterium]
MSIIRTALLSGVVLFSASGVRAQNPAGQAQDRADLLRTPVTLREEPTDSQTGSDNAHAIASPNDPDLGEQAILKRSENYQAFTVFASLPVSYTSNVALVRTGEQSDVLFTPSFGMSYTPRITKTLYANIGFAQQFFLYNDFDALNFASFDVRAGLVYTVPEWHNLLLRVDYDFNRLSGTDLSREIFVDHSISVGAELPFRIGRAQQVSVGVDLDFSVAADPSPPERHDYSAFVGYSVNLTRDLTL